MTWITIADINDTIEVEGETPAPPAPTPPTPAPPAPTPPTPTPVPETEEDKYLIRVYGTAEVPVRTEERVIVKQPIIKQQPVIKEEKTIEEKTPEKKNWWLLVLIALILGAIVGWGAKK